MVENAHDPRAHQAKRGASACESRPWRVYVRPAVASAQDRDGVVIDCAWHRGVARKRCLRHLRLTRHAAAHRRPENPDATDRRRRARRLTRRRIGCDRHRSAHSPDGTQTLRRTTRTRTTRTRTAPQSQTRPDADAPDEAHNRCDRRRRAAPPTGRRTDVIDAGAVRRKPRGERRRVRALRDAG